MAKTETTETAKLPDPPAGAFTHVEQKAQVSCSVDGQLMQFEPPEREDGETTSAYSARLAEAHEAFDNDPDFRCTVTRVIIWPNGQVQREAKELKRCKYKEVRKYQKDSDAAAQAAGF